jgi:hypothetical protein
MMNLFRRAGPLATATTTIAAETPLQPVQPPGAPKSGDHVDRDDPGAAANNRRFRSHVNNAHEDVLREEVGFKRSRMIEGQSTSRNNAASPRMDLEDEEGDELELGGAMLSSDAGDERKKRPRTAFTATQIKALEAEFEKNKYLSVSKRMQLSKSLKLTETQVIHA